MYHVTRNEREIRAEGFHGKARKSGEGSGAYFGAGTYFHTSKAHSDQYLAGTRQYGFGDETQIRAHAEVKRPFEVRVQPNEQQALPGEVMHRALRQAGFAKPGEKLKPSEITARLQAAGYDGIWVRQAKFSHEISGDQLVVFDPKRVGYGHAK